MPGDKLPEGTSVVIDGLEQPAVVYKDGMAIMGSDGKMVRLVLSLETHFQTTI